MPAEVDLSIVIVNYKTPRLLFDCIQSIFADTHGISYEIIVVDNHSEDDSKALVLTAFPFVQWIPADYNSGFSRGNNRGLRQAGGQYVLLLNSDTIVKNNFMARFLSAYKTSDADGTLGLLGCRIISSVDGSLLIGSGMGFLGPKRLLQANPAYILLKRWLKRPTVKPYDAYDMHYKNHDVDFVSGACVMLKREKLLAKNLFLDEDFFLYYEDVEWSYRVRKLGYKNRFCADVEVYHVNAGSSQHNLGRNAQIELSSYLFLRKAYSPLVYVFCATIAFLNFALNGFLLRRNRQAETWKNNRFRYGIWKKYVGKVFFGYAKRPSSQPNFLRYDA